MTARFEREATIIAVILLRNGDGGWWGRGGVSKDSKKRVFFATLVTCSTLEMKGCLAKNSIIVQAKKT
jgi:hypothetical protein